MMKCQGVIATYVSDTINADATEGDWGAIQLRVFEDHPTDYNNVGRTISLVHDECGWEFDTSGEQLPCENVERYKARRIRDRFSLEALLECLHYFGIDAYNKSFYTDHCALYHPPKPTYTGKELRIDGKVIHLPKRR